MTVDGSDAAPGTGKSTFVMFVLVFPFEQVAAPIPESEEFRAMPGYFRFMIRNVHWFFVLFWCLSAVMLVSAIGLLLRKNWARLIFIALVAFGIVWNLGGLGLQLYAMFDFPPMPAEMPADVRGGFETMRTIMSVVTAIMAIGFAVLLGWIIKRLISPGVRAEFNAP